jgi:glycosyltransferase 2 family protein
VSAAPQRALGRVVLAWGVRLLGPLLLLVLLARMDAPRVVVDALLAADFRYVAAALVLNVFNIHLKVDRWRGLLRATGIDYARKPAWGGFMSSMYLGMVTPGRVGDALRAHYLHKDLGVPYSDGVASVVVDRVCDLLVLAVLASLAVVHFGGALFDLQGVLWVFVGASLLLPIPLLVPTRLDDLLETLARRLGRGAWFAPRASRSPELLRNPDKVLGMLRAFRAYRVGAVVTALPTTVLAFFVNFLQGWLVMRALGLDLTFFDVSALVVLGSLVGLMPISVSGIGLREAVFAAIFPMLGHSADAGVTFGLAFFLVIYVVLALLGFVAWQIRPPTSAPLLGKQDRPR